MATPRNNYRPSPIVEVDGESINLATVHSATMQVGGALVLCLIDPADPSFDEVEHTRVLNLPDSAAVLNRYRSCCR